MTMKSFKARRYPRTDVKNAVHYFNCRRRSILEVEIWASRSTKFTFEIMTYTILKSLPGRVSAPVWFSCVDILEKNWSMCSWVDLWLMGRKFTLTYIHNNIERCMVIMSHAEGIINFMIVLPSWTFFWIPEGHKNPTRICREVLSSWRLSVAGNLPFISFRTDNSTWIVRLESWGYCSMST